MQYIVGYIWYAGSTETIINHDVLKKKRKINQSLKERNERKEEESWVWEWRQVLMISISGIGFRIIENRKND